MGWWMATILPSQQQGMALSVPSLSIVEQCARYAIAPVTTDDM